jgi:hypothetical protein
MDETSFGATTVSIRICLWIDPPLLITSTRSRQKKEKKEPNLDRVDCAVFVDICNYVKLGGCVISGFVPRLITIDVTYRYLKQAKKHLLHRVMANNDVDSNAGN